VRQRALTLGLLPALVLVGRVCPAEPGEDVRGQIERTAVFLDEAVHQTSRPSPLGLFEPSQMTRGYRIPGVGVVFVTPSRSLPSPRTVRWRERALAAARRQGNAAAPAPATAASQPRSGQGGAAPAGQNVITRGRFEFRGDGLSEAEKERVLKSLEEQARMLQENSQRDYQEAERQLQQMMRSTAPGVGPAEVENGTLLLPPMPPWNQALFGEEAPDTRTAQQVLDDVRQALAQALAANPPSFLAAEESLIVTVDFFDDDVLDFVARPVSTLVARVQAKDVAACRAGSLSFEDFKKRIEYSEIH
jgi:hypothetical protein